MAWGGARNLISTQCWLDGVACRAHARLGGVLAVLVGAPAHLDEQHLLEARPRHDFYESKVVLPVRVWSEARRIDGVGPTQCKKTPRRAMTSTGPQTPRRGLSAARTRRGSGTRRTPPVSRSRRTGRILSLPQRSRPSFSRRVNLVMGCVCVLSWAAMPMQRRRIGPRRRRAEPCIFGNVR